MNNEDLELLKLKTLLTNRRTKGIRTLYCLEYKLCSITILGSTHYVCTDTVLSSLYLVCNAECREMCSYLIPLESYELHAVIDKYI